MDTDAPEKPISGGVTSPPTVTPTYGTAPKPVNNVANSRETRCVTGPSFLGKIHGILNIIIIISLVLVLISAGVASGYNGKQADATTGMTNVRVSATGTRNAVLVFAVIGLIVILIDTVLHATSLILHVPKKFDMIVIVLMLILGGIFFILGCCAAAWEQKMKDTVGKMGIYQRPGAAGSASCFLFVAMIATLIDFILRLTRPVKREENQ